jgi:hypothetical protein
MVSAEMTMDTREWREFLVDYSAKTLLDPQLEQRASIPSMARRENWLGYPPATDEAISDAERRIDRPLPRSLRSFYLVSNGWPCFGRSLHSILPVEKIGWVNDVYPYIHDILETDFGLYFDACDEITKLAGVNVDEFDQPVSVEPDYHCMRVARSIVLSDDSESGIIVVDPYDSDPTGEWPSNEWSVWHTSKVWDTAGLVGLFRTLCTSHPPQIE